MHFLLALAIFVASCYACYRPEKAFQQLRPENRSFARGCAFVFAVLSGLVLLWTSVWTLLAIAVVATVVYQVHKHHQPVGRHKKSSLRK